MTQRNRDATGLRPATRAVHGGEHIDIRPALPTVNPIHFSTSFVFESTQDLDAVFDNPSESYAYARFGNPTVRALEEAIAGIENAEATIAYPSGMAAIYGVFTLLARPGDHVVVSRDVYGATLTILNGHFTDMGITPHFVDITDVEEVERVTEEVKPTVIYTETMSNPLLKIADLKGLNDIAHKSDATFVVDNTFATPAIVRPIEFGADLVLHSTTKFIAGHGDVMGGVVSGPTVLVDALRKQARLNGAVPGPFDAWLCTRGLKTLHLRMREHSANARKLAEWLCTDPRIDKVYYPGLESDVFADQFVSDDRSGMISFEAKGFGKENAFRFLESLRLIEPATTLGDVYTLSLYPAASSHRGLTREQRENWGIKDNLLRISVGIEDIRDIIEDIDQALTAASE